MPDLPDDNSISGVEPNAPEPSLRDIAEKAYDDISTPDDADDSASTDGRTRDERGRFVAKEPQEPGEAEPKAPSPEKPQTEAQEPPDPAAQARSNQPPEHWSAEDRATFQKLPQDAQSMFMRRYQEMEADYTRKSQANATAVQAVQALAPIFQDPDIARSLQENRMHPLQAISDWARMHKAATNPDPRVRAGTLYEIAERMGFDPAKVFNTNRQPDPNVPPAVQNDPAYKFVSDLNQRTNSDLQALRAELHQFRQQEQQKVEDEALRVTRWSIDNYADEKGPDGRALRPYFDRALPRIIEMYKVNSDRDLQQAYDEACWADPEIRKDLLLAERNRAQQGNANQRALQAARSNVRGLTSPVAKPAAEKKGNGSLRDMLEASADEVGF